MLHSRSLSPRNKPFSDKFFVSATNRLYMSDPYHISGILRCARPNGENMHKVEAFVRSRPQRMGWGDVAELLTNHQADVLADDQRCRSIVLRHDEYTATYNNPVLLASYINDTLSPMRRLVLEWYVDLRRSGGKRESLEILLAMQYLPVNNKHRALIQRYAALCINDASKDTCDSLQLRSALCDKDIITVEDILRLRLLDHHVPTIASTFAHLSPQLRDSIKNYLYSRCVRALEQAQRIQRELA